MKQARIVAGRLTDGYDDRVAVVLSDSLGVATKSNEFGQNKVQLGVNAGADGFADVAEEETCRIGQACSLGSCCAEERSEERFDAVKEVLGDIAFGLLELS